MSWLCHTTATPQYRIWNAWYNFCAKMRMCSYLLSTVFHRRVLIYSSALVILASNYVLASSSNRLKIHFRITWFQTSVAYCIALRLIMVISSNFICYVPHFAWRINFNILFWCLISVHNLRDKYSHPLILNIAILVTMASSWLTLQTNMLQYSHAIPVYSLAVRP